MSQHVYMQIYANITAPVHCTMLGFVSQRTVRPCLRLCDKMQYFVQPQLSACVFNYGHPCVVLCLFVKHIIISAGGVGICCVILTTIKVGTQALGPWGNWHCFLGIC